MQEIITTYVQFSTGRYIGHAAGIAIIECHQPFRQPFKVGWMNILTTIWWQITTVEGIKHDHDLFHW